VRAAPPPDTRVVAGQLHRVTRASQKGFVAEPPPGPVHRPARVAVMLALAHKIKRAIERGEIRDQAEAARNLRLTRARLTQPLDLTLLAPDLQEEILFLEVIDGVEPPREKTLRGVLRLSTWADQRSTLDALDQRRPKTACKP
jgi:hypothetical protein